MQQEAAKPNVCDCTSILEPTATVYEAVAQLVQASMQVNLRDVLLHIMKCAALQACLWYNCELSLIAVLQYLGHLLCGLRFQS